jgi:hypothetical protein
MLTNLLVLAGLLAVGAGVPLLWAWKDGLLDRPKGD